MDWNMMPSEPTIDQVTEWLRQLREEEMQLETALVAACTFIIGFFLGAMVNLW